MKPVSTAWHYCPSTPESRLMGRVISVNSYHLPQKICVHLISGMLPGMLHKGRMTAAVHSPCPSRPGPSARIHACCDVMAAQSTIAYATSAERAGFIKAAMPGLLCRLPAARPLAPHLCPITKPHHCCYATKRGQQDASGGNEGVRAVQN